MCIVRSVSFGVSNGCHRGRVEWEIRYELIKAAQATCSGNEVSTEFVGSKLDALSKE